MIQSTLGSSRDNHFHSKWSAMDLEVVSPPVLLIVLLLIATIGPIATSLSLMLLLPVLLYTIQRYYSAKNRLIQTKFFLSWSISSLIILICVFELQVVPYLEILFVENLILILLTSSALIMVMIIRKEIESRIHSNFDQSFYNFWIRSTVSQRFVVIYIVSQVLASMALLYGSHLTLTTICHSSLVYQTVLIPDDCSEVYIGSDIRMCFVCGIYSIQIAVCIIFCLFRRLFIWLRNGNKPVIKYIKLNRIES